MNKPYEPDFIKVTEIFLVPSSFLVAALGTADTNFHRAAVSLIGFVVAAMWWFCSREALLEADLAEGATNRFSRRTRILAWLPILFMFCWLVSLVAHLVLGRQPLGDNF
jgi:hypothetical protein